ncbi:MAG TPA: sulfite exporter TauE/SafE family protein [Polyangiaceae bacterium]|nr:sulfite exporter TauE/SafE family protein [Polyangiaceae bacterium]
MTPLQTDAALAAASFVAGIFAAITGGTSLLTVPVMLITGMSAGTAVATNMLVITSLSVGSALRFRSAGVTPWKPTVALVALSVPGSVLGASLAVHMNELALRTVIAVALLGMTIVLAWHPKLEARTRTPSTRVAGYLAWPSGRSTAGCIPAATPRF